MPTYFDLLDKYTCDKIKQMASILLFKDVMNELLFKSRDSLLKYYIDMRDYLDDGVEKYNKSMNRIKNNAILQKHYFICMNDDRLREYTMKKIQEYKTMDI